MPLSDRVRSLYPFEPKSLDIDGWKYSYVDAGEGRPVLFVHGNPTWSFAWRKFVQALSPDYRALAVDHIGCGLSDKPQDYPYTLEKHIQNLCQFIERLDLRGVTLVAHDWGGAIGMGAAGRLPDRFDRFVLMNTAAFRSDRIPARIAACRIPVFGPLGVRGLNLFSRMALTMAVNRPERMTADVAAGYLAPYDNWANRVAVLRFVQDIPLDPRHPSYDTLKGVEEGLSQFRDSPVLLVWGEQDWCFTLHFFDRFREFFPQAQTLRLPQAGHYLFEDASEEILSRLQQFLAD